MCVDSILECRHGGALIGLSHHPQRLIFTGFIEPFLDTLFGAEEEFEYTSTTTPSSTGTPVGTS